MIKLTQPIFVVRKKQFSFSKCRVILMCFSSLVTTSTRPCTTLTVLQWYASTWIAEPISSISSESVKALVSTGSRKSWRRWLFQLSPHLVIYSQSASVIEIWNLQTCSYFHKRTKSRSSTLVSQKTTSGTQMMVVWERWRLFVEHPSIWVLPCGRHMWKMEVTHAM